MTRAYFIDINPQSGSYTINDFAKDFITMKSFLKFYVMGRTEIDLFGIAHVKVEFIPVLTIYVI